MGERGISLSLFRRRSRKPSGGGILACILPHLPHKWGKPNRRSRMVVPWLLPVYAHYSVGALPLASSFPPSALPPSPSFRSMTSNCAAQILFSRAIYPRLSSSSRRLWEPLSLLPSQLSPLSSCVGYLLSTDTLSWFTHPLEIGIFPHVSRARIEHAVNSKKIPRIADFNPATCVTMALHDQKINGSLISKLGVYTYCRLNFFLSDKITR